jgi:hypothetical protein
MRCAQEESYHRCHIGCLNLSDSPAFPHLFAIHYQGNEATFAWILDGSTGVLDYHLHSSYLWKNLADCETAVSPVQSTYCLVSRRDTRNIAKLSQSFTRIDVLVTLCVCENTFSEQQLGDALDFGWTYSISSNIRRLYFAILDVY